MFRTTALVLLAVSLPNVAFATCDMDMEKFLLNPVGKGGAGQSAWKFVEKRATYGPAVYSNQICLDGWMRFVAGGSVEIVCENGQTARGRWSLSASQGEGCTLILRGSERHEYVLYTRAGSTPRIRLQDPETSKDAIKMYYIFEWSSPYGAKK